MSINILHAGLGNATMLFSLIIGVYGMALYFRRQGVTSSYWGVLALGQVLYTAQFVAGLVLLIQGGEPVRGWVHYLYGVVGPISLPAMYAFTRGHDTQREALMYGALGLFLLGITYRAWQTALFPY